MGGVRAGTDHGRFRHLKMQPGAGTLNVRHSCKVQGVPRKEITVEGTEDDRKSGELA